MTRQKDATISGEAQAVFDMLAIIAERGCYDRITDVLIREAMEAIETIQEAVSTRPEGSRPQVR